MATTAMDPPRRRPAKKSPGTKLLYVQVLIAIVARRRSSARSAPTATGDWIKPLGDGFIKLIKMMIAPIIFCTVVHGIAAYPGREEGRPRRRQGARLFRGRLDVRAGHRPDRRQSSSGPATASHRSGHARCRRRSPATPSRRSSRSAVGFLLNIIPDTFVGAFAGATSCRCCCSPILFGFALLLLGERGRTGAARSSTTLAHGHLRRRRHRHEGRADRRLRRHGLHHRQVRRRVRCCNLVALIATFYLTRRCSCSSCWASIARLGRLLDLPLHRATSRTNCCSCSAPSSSESALPR